MAVATYTYDTLPPAERDALPPVDAVTQAFTGAAMCEGATAGDVINPAATDIAADD